MEQNEDSRSLPEIVIHTVSISQTVVLSLLGNSLICLVFYQNRRLRTIANINLLSLVMAKHSVFSFKNKIWSQY